ncbi:MAG: S49 family peptidase [Pseudomonadota bacterium]
MSEEKKPENWERDLLTRVAMAGVNEQRRARRWRIAIWLLAFAYLAFILVVLVGQGKQMASAAGDHVAVVQVNGMIAPETVASADFLIPALRDAMENKHSKALLVRINSPGGSPVQSDLIYSELLRLRELYPEKPVYAVIEDIGASGAYYIASGAEKIFAAEASLVGSIGVTSGGSFGFVEAIEKLGIERRIYTSGDNKAFLDPFLPEREDDVDRYEAMLENVHRQFIAAVDAERGERLAEDDSLFNGYIWTGEESLELGLVDGFGDIRGIARESFDTEELVDYTPKQDFFTRFADRLGASAARTLVETLAPPPSLR